MNTRILLTLPTLLGATLLTGCVVSFAPPAAVAPNATALAIHAQRHDGLQALDGSDMPAGSAAVEPVVVAAIR